MRLSLQVALGYFLIVGLAGWFVLNLTSAIGRMRRYAQAVAEGQRTPPPKSSARELADLAAALTALFGALYGLLVSEDLALLMGSLLLFGLLALVMVITRRLDWYGLDQGTC